MISLLLSLVSISLLTPPTEARTEVEAGAQQRLESEISAEVEAQQEVSAEVEAQQEVQVSVGGSYRYEHLDTFCLDPMYKNKVTQHITKGKAKEKTPYFSLIAGTRNTNPNPNPNHLNPRLELTESPIPKPNHANIQRRGVSTVKNHGI